MMLVSLLQIIGFILVTSFAGFNIITAYDRKAALSKLELAGLSYLFGIGAISVEMFVMGLSGVKFDTMCIMAPWLILFLFNMPRLRNIVIAKRMEPMRGLPLAVTALLISVIGYAFFMALVRPIESYDAVAIWSLKAKILYFARTVPPDFFAMVESRFAGAHPDYPLLLPFSQAWFYTFINGFNDLLVKALFPLNFLAFLTVFYSFMKKAVSNRTAALLATFMLASIRQFSNYATNGYADMQMAIYGSLTFLALYLWIREGSNTYFWTAFVSCIFAMWTKNEGAVTMLGFIVVMAVYAATRTSDFKKQLSSNVGVILAPAILIALFVSWSAFKGCMNIQNDVVNAGVFKWHSISDAAARAMAILYEYQRQTFGVKYWNLSWIAFLLVIIFRYKRIFSEEDRYITIPAFFILLCYTAVYFITPQDIHWHLRTSASRLLIHILPLAIFLVALEAKRIYYGVDKDE